jgi:hypothetical protein
MPTREQLMPTWEQLEGAWREHRSYTFVPLTTDLMPDTPHVYPSVHNPMTCELCILAEIERIGRPVPEPPRPGRLADRLRMRRAIAV